MLCFDADIRSKTACRRAVPDKLDLFDACEGSFMQAPEQSMLGLLCIKPEFSWLVAHTGVGFRMPLAPALTPLQAMRQQLVSRSLASLGALDADEAAAANERRMGDVSEQKAAPQPPVAPRRVSLSVCGSPFRNLKTVRKLQQGFVVRICQPFSRFSRDT